MRTMGVVLGICIGVALGCSLGTIDEKTTLFELQNAVKKNKVVSYLAGEKEEAAKPESHSNHYMQY